MDALLTAATAAAAVAVELIEALAIVLAVGVSPVSYKQLTLPTTSRV
jgi:hypothetical protein